MDENIVVYPPVEPAADKIYRLAEAVTSLIPVGQTVLHSLISSPIQRRMEAWIANVENRLVGLEAKGLIDYQELLSRPEFSALIMRAIQSAAITSQKEKLLSLENFLMNVALNPNLEEDELYILLNILTEFTPSHLKVLEYYARPRRYIVGIKERPEKVKPPKNQLQGWELSIVFGHGDIEYWQNIFWLVSGHHLVNNIESRAHPGTKPVRPLYGSATRLGLQLLSLIEVDE
jgi:hypothetical protein